MCKLTKTLLMQIDQKNPTEKLIGVLAQATDFEFAEIKKVQQESHLSTLQTIKELKEDNKNHFTHLTNSLHESIGEISMQIEKHNSRCPLGLEDKVKETTDKVDQLDWLLTIKKYPWIAAMIALGLFALFNVGADKLISFLIGKI